jgi:adenylosuccinate lyase
MTSSDVLDTALALQTVRALDAILAGHRRPRRRARRAGAAPTPRRR